MSLNHFKRALSSAFFLFTLVLIGCAQGNCRSQGGRIKGDANKLEAEMKNSNPTEERVKVYKYDGSLQCGMGKAIPLDEMAKELKGITIFSSVNKPDNLMHIQQCGTPTGHANVYEINISNLPAAQKLGFKQWSFE